MVFIIWNYPHYMATVGQEQGYQHGFGRTMNQDSCGLIGLLDL